MKQILPNQIPFDQLLIDLRNGEKRFSPRYLPRLSDLIKEEQEQLKTAWPDVPVWRRLALMEDLADLSATDLVLSFDAVGKIALLDSEPGVRKLAIGMLIESEDPELVPFFSEQVIVDPDVEVRAEIASALRIFVYLHELEEINPRLGREVEDCLLRVTMSEDAPIVRQRALEALGFSQRTEVPPLIENAYRSDQRDWQIAALCAMGRSANEQWKLQILGMLDHDHTAIRAEAVTAAGELGLQDAIPQLLQMLTDEDDLVRTAVIWALSQTGGERVREALEALLEATDDDNEAEFIEEALENLDFTEDLQFLTLDLDDLMDD